MEFEFMTAGTPLPPCMPLPPVLLRLPASSTAKVMYARMLDEALAYGIEDENGILYIHFPIKELAAALSRSCFFQSRPCGRKAFAAARPDAPQEALRKACFAAECASLHLSAFCSPFCCSCNVFF